MKELTKAQMNQITGGWVSLAVRAAVHVAKSAGRAYATYRAAKSVKEDKD